MIRLTTSHYYTPSGRCIQKPYEKGEKKKYSEDLNNRFTHGELMHLDSIRLDSSKVFRTLIKGRKVYGGGGIMPDVFVPLDTTAYTPYYRAINRNNLITETTLRFCDKNRKKLIKEYENFDDYLNNYEVPQSLVDEVIAKAKEKKIEPKDEKERAETLEDLRFMLKALVAYNVWDRSEYFRIINTRSDIVKQALKELQAATANGR